MEIATKFYKKQGDAPQTLVKDNNYERELILSSSSDSNGNGGIEANAVEV